MEGLNEDKINENNFINPYRIVLDPQCRIPMDAKVVTDTPERTIICFNEGQEQDEKALTLGGRGVHLVSLPMHDDAFNWEALWRVLITPTATFPGIASILVEGGSRTWKEFQRALLVDEAIHLVGRFL